jgi:hypothetical protein
MKKKKEEISRMGFQSSRKIAGWFPQWNHKLFIAND